MFPDGLSPLEIVDRDNLGTHKTENKRTSLIATNERSERRADIGFNRQSLDRGLHLVFVL
jgi:hypothetical protein